MSFAWDTRRDTRRDSNVACWIKAAVFFALMFGAVCVAMQGATIRPDLIHSGHSQPYRFDRIGADDVAWFRQAYGPNEIPSAPIRLWRDEENGRIGNGAGRQCETPEPATLAMVLIGAACFGLRRWM